MQNPAIQSLVEDVRHTVSVASLNFDIWWVYRSNATRPKYIRAMNAYGLFFQTSIHAHFVATLVALYRLYETRRDTSNIPNLLKALKKADDFSREALNRANEIYLEAKPLWKKVSILRNEGFGHLRAGGSVTDAFKKAGLKPDDLRELIMLTKRLINAITNALDRSVHAFNLSATNATTSMLEALRAHLGES